MSSDRIVCCGDNYISGYSFRDHLKKVHFYKGKTIDGKPFKCVLCEKFYINTYSYIGHMNSKHRDTLVKNLREHSKNPSEPVLEADDCEYSSDQECSMGIDLLPFSVCESDNLQVAENVELATTDFPLSSKPTSNRIKSKQFLNFEEKFSICAKEMLVDDHNLTRIGLNMVLSRTLEFFKNNDMLNSDKEAECSSAFKIATSPTRQEL